MKSITMQLTKVLWEENYLWQEEVAFFLFYVPYFKQKNFIKHFRKLITIPFKFSSEGSTILFKNIGKELIQ